MQHEREGQLVRQCLDGELFPQPEGGMYPRRALHESPPDAETVFEYIEIDYNRQRRHSTPGNINPEAFEARMSA